jgi:hypothetical protein
MSYSSLHVVTKYGVILCRVSIQFFNQIEEEEFDCVDLTVVGKEKGVVENGGIAIEKKTQ